MFTTSYEVGPRFAGAAAAPIPYTARPEAEDHRRGNSPITAEATAGPVQVEPEDASPEPACVRVFLCPVRGPDFARDDRKREMNKEQKEQAVAEIGEELKASNAVFAVNYRGISVSDAAELRGKLREADASFTVVKNRLAKRITAETGAEALDEHLVGPTALTYVKGDAVLAAKAISDFIKDSEGVISYKGGLMEGKPLDADGFKQIARLPGVEQLRGQLVGLTASPLTGLVTGLNGLLQGLASQLGQIAEGEMVPRGAAAEEAATEEKPAEEEAEAPAAEAKEEPAADESPAEEAEAEDQPAVAEESQDGEADDAAEAPAEDGDAEDGDDAEAPAEPEADGGGDAEASAGSGAEDDDTEAETESDAEESSDDSEAEETKED